MSGSLGRVCFATPGVYPLLADQAVTVSGGSERRALHFLKALERTGRYVLALISFDSAQPDMRSIGAVRIIRDPFYAPRRTGRLVRATSRLLAAARRAESEAPIETAAWAEADAQVYVAFGVGDYSAKLARWANAHGRHLVLVAGSDCDFSDSYRADAVGRNAYGGDLALCREAIDRAGTIVVQTRTQQRLAAGRFGRSAQIVANPIDLSDDDAPGVPPFPSGHALWIGKSDRIKRPDLVLDVARACPDVPFVMVVNPADRDLFGLLQAQRPANVRIIAGASNVEIAALLASAFCLVNTSVFEGFPNTFLEAGRHGVPIVSLAVNPDGIITENAAGVDARGDLNALSAAVRTYHGDREAARKAGANLRAYVRAAHDAAAQLAKFESLIDSLVSHGSASDV